MDERLMNGYTIRRMRRSDLDEIMRIEELSFSVPWSRGAFERELTENRTARYLVIDVDGKPVAYAGAWIIYDPFDCTAEAHITNIAVHPDYRGQGLGSEITRAMLRLARALSASVVTLEVRVSNRVAQRLYERLGFAPLGVRKKYYDRPVEDALLMVCTQMPETDEEAEGWKDF